MTPGGPVGLLAVEDDVPSNFFEVLEEACDCLDAVPVFAEVQAYLACTPELEKYDRRMWSDPLQSSPDAVLPKFARVEFRFHDDLPFRRSPRLAAKARGGALVKGGLSDRQRSLFSTSWYKRTVIGGGRP